SCRVSADRLVDVLDRHVVSMEMAGRNRSAVENHARDVEAGERHRRGGGRLFTAPDDHPPHRQGGPGGPPERNPPHPPAPATPPRRTREAPTPADPIVIPSEMETVLNSIGVPPASRIPSFTHDARSRRCRLHGPISIQVFAIPTIGFASALRSNPAARSIA